MGNNKDEKKEKDAQKNKKKGSAGHMDCTTMANKYVDCGAKCCYTNAWYMSDPDKRRCKAGKAAKQTKDKKCHFKPSFMPTTPGAPFGGGTNPCGIQNKVLKAYFVKKCKAATGAAPSVKKAATKMDCT